MLQQVFYCRAGDETQTGELNFVGMEGEVKICS